MSYIGNLPTNVAFVTDTFNGDGSTVAFTMSVAPASTSSVLIAITGVLQDPSTYSVSGTTLTFSAAPPSGTANISARYLGIPASGVTTTAYRTVTDFTATAGQTTFTPPSYTVGYIDVYRNGAKLGAADFTATNGTTVVLASGATAGDLIETVSFYVSSVLNALPNTSGSVQQTNLASGVAGNGPAFSATPASGQTITNGSTTKLSFGTEQWDTNSCYDNTNSKFVPNVAGYYFIDTAAYAGSSVNTFLSIYKNGAAYQRGIQVGYATSTLVASTQVYCNGSTDYIEVYITNNTGSSVTVDAYDFITKFQGHMVRAA